MKSQQRQSHECMHVQLVEIVMDLGRPPLARFPSGDLKLADDVISTADLDHAISKVLAHSHSRGFRGMMPHKMSHLDADP